VNAALKTDFSLLNSVAYRIEKKGSGHFKLMARKEFCDE
jgi:hypothetical protein